MKNISQHGERLRVSYFRRWDAVFKGHRYRYLKQFHLPEGQAAVTPFGHKIRHGHIIEDIDTGERLVIGISLLRTVCNHYHAMQMPEHLRNRRKRTS